MIKWLKKTSCAECGKKDEEIARFKGVAYHVLEEKVHLTKRHETELRTARNEVYDKNDQISRLKSSLARAIKKAESLEKRLDQLENLVREKESRRLPEEFFGKISGDHIPIRTQNVLRNEGIETYYDLAHVEARNLLRLPNFGAKSLKALRKHLWEKFPDHVYEFCLVGE